jgi:hypothetical protein
MLHAWCRVLLSNAPCAIGGAALNVSCSRDLRLRATRPTSRSRAHVPQTLQLFGSLQVDKYKTIVCKQGNDCVCVCVRVCVCVCARVRVCVCVCLAIEERNQNTITTARTAKIELSDNSLIDSRASSGLWSVVANRTPPLAHSTVRESPMLNMWYQSDVTMHPEQL